MKKMWKHVYNKQRAVVQALSFDVPEDYEYLPGEFPTRELLVDSVSEAEDIRWQEHSVKYSASLKIQNGQ